MDIKSVDSEMHKKYTGVPNEKILENAKLVSKITKMVVRVPLVPDFNSSEKDILELCDYVKTLNDINTVHLLPYHTYGENKYDLLGRDYLMKKTRAFALGEVEKLQKIIEEQGIKCVIGG
ncbi:4-hydroxyphenylacetate decarboxylase activating enzyme [compost metagenome]